MNPKLPDTEKCPICPNNLAMLRESPAVARIYCPASTGPETFTANHQQCLACGLLGLTEATTAGFTTLDLAFSQRSFK